MSETNDVVNDNNKIKLCGCTCDKLSYIVAFIILISTICLIVLDVKVWHRNTWFGEENFALDIRCSSIDTCHFNFPPPSKYKKTRSLSHIRDL